MRERHSFERLPWISVAEGASTPDPGGAGAAGTPAFSVTLAKPVWWTGTAWSSTWGGSAASGATVTLTRVAANVAYSSPASSAANLEANTNKADAYVLSVEANTIAHVEAILDFTVAAATTGIAIGVTATANAAGTANLKLNASIVAPVTNAAAATSVERIRGIATTSLGATIGTALVNTASVSPQGVHVTATLVNRGSGAATFRIVFGTEVSSSAVTLLADSVIKTTVQAT